MTIFSEVENLEAVFSFVKMLPQIDNNNIFTFCGSQGGLVTSLTCDNRSEEIRGMMFGRGFFESIHGYDVFSKVGQYRNNVLVMHGDQDPIVALGYSERIVRSYEQVRLEVFQGEGHGFSPEGNRRMTEMVYEFVASNLYK